MFNHQQNEQDTKGKLQNLVQNEAAEPEFYFFKI